MNNRSATNFRDLPLRRIALWAFVLNALWEFGQCTLLYNMWEWGFWRGALWMWGAIAGDVVIVLAIVTIAFMVIGEAHLNPPDVRGWLVLISTSIIASIVLEWAALCLELWDYSALMPTLDVFGFSVGLSPIVQITLLPSLSIWLAFRQTVTASDERRLSVKQ